MNEKIRVLIMRPGEDAEEAWIAPAHDVLVNITGGEITMQNPMDDGTVIISKKSLAPTETTPSRILRNSRGQVVSRYYGTIIVAGVFMKAGELDSLTDDEIKLANRRLEAFRPTYPQKEVDDE